MTNLDERNPKEMIEEIISNLINTEKIATLEFEESNGKGEYTKLDLFDISGLRDFYETLIKLRQWDDSFVGNYSFKKRLVKVNKYLDVETRAKHSDMLKPHIIRGLFLELEVCFIPHRFVEIGKTRKGIYSVPVLEPPKDPESLGLPGSSDIIWSTVQEIDSMTCVAISCRGEQAWLKDWIQRASSWEYVKVE